MSQESEDSVHTICPYCGVGCGLQLEQGDEEGDVNIRPWFDAPVNEGALCIKGGAATEVVNHDERLKEPLIREGDEFREATWEEAVERVTDEMERIREEYGRTAMGFYGSSKCTNEENYLLQKLARRYGNNNVDNCTRMCHASTVAALRTCLGAGAMTNSMEDLREAADVYWIQGANPSEQHPIAHSKYFKQAALKDTFVIQVDPHANKTTRDADLHLQLKPGTDIPLLNVVLKTVLDNEWIDQKFIDERTEGFDDVVGTLEGFDVEEAAETCGVPLDDIQTAAEAYATANHAAIFTGMGMSQHACGTDNVQNLINLALMTGNLGRPGTGVNPLRGQNNVQGTCDVGTMYNTLPGYIPIDDNEKRAEVAEVWGFEPPVETGLSNVEITQAAGDQIHGLYVMGENPVISEPNGNEVIENLERMEFIVVQDIFMTDTAALADVILPATSWAERGGTVTNTDRRVQRIRAATRVPGNTKHDLEILSEVGTRLFDEGFDFDSAEAIFEELRQVMTIYHGITYEHLGLDGIQWPCYEEGDEGDPYLYEESFDTENGLGKLRGVRHQPPKEVEDAEYPFVLTTARLEEHYNTGTMSTRSPTLMRRTGENFVDIHPNDADSLGVEDEEYVKLVSRRGEVVVKAHVTTDIKRGVIWTTTHFPDSPINKLTNDALDPVAKIPEYKASAAMVDVEPTAQPSD